MNDGYEYWRAKLAGEDPDPPEDRTILPLGFWRLRRGDPLAVYMNDGARIAVVGFEESYRFLPEVAMEEMAERGGFGEAVEEAFYREAIAKGYWPDSEGPTRDLMNGLIEARDGLSEAIDQIQLKIAIYPDHRLTKKLRKEIAEAIVGASQAAGSYDAATQEKEPA